MLKRCRDISSVISTPTVASLFDVVKINAAAGLELLLIQSAIDRDGLDEEVGPFFGIDTRLPSKT